MDKPRGHWREPDSPQVPPEVDEEGFTVRPDVSHNNILPFCDSMSPRRVLLCTKELQVQALSCALSMVDRGRVESQAMVTHLFNPEAGHLRM